MIPGVTERPYKHVGFHAGSSSFPLWPGGNESLGTDVCTSCLITEAAPAPGLSQVLASPSPEAADVTMTFLCTPNLFGVIFIPGRVLEIANIVKTSPALKIFLPQAQTGPQA